MIEISIKVSGRIGISMLTVDVVLVHRSVHTTYNLLKPFWSIIPSLPQAVVFENLFSSSAFRCTASRKITPQRTTESEIIVISVSISQDTSGYGDPETWPELYKTCGAENQSPIALPLPCDADFKINFPPFKFSKSSYEVPQNVTVTRESYTVKVEFANSYKIRVTGLQKDTYYVLTQVHFHWGDNNLIGSEHSMNGSFYSMEIHAVFYNAYYGSFTDAQTKPDGLMVFTYFAKVVPKTSTSQSSTMDSIANAIKLLTQRDITKVKVKKPFSFAKFFPILQDNYVAYHGSLTTPPCYESVTFIVFEKPLEISAENMAAFRGLYAVEPGTRNNFRPLQPRNGRKITGKCKCT
ncbi:carbonic anhydrase-like isoform X2 [Onthophagus taurus]|uniref:carbonic anhydrase-like isoform X2 n=1 Tax=Onthophagus taurus TaxID=166361 RepID=UPI0039BE202E